MSALRTLDDQKAAWREASTLRERCHEETTAALANTQSAAAVQHREQWERVSALSVDLARNAATGAPSPTEHLEHFAEERGRLEEQRGLMHEETRRRRLDAVEAEERARADALRQEAQQLAREQWEETNRREESGLRIENLERRLAWETEKYAGEHTAREAWEAEQRARTESERTLQQDYDHRREKLELQLQSQLELERTYHKAAHAQLVEQFKAPVMVEVVRELDSAAAAQMVQAHLVNDFLVASPPTTAAGMEVDVLDDTMDTELSASVDIGDVEWSQEQPRPPIAVSSAAGTTIPFKATMDPNGKAREEDAKALADDRSHSYTADSEKHSHQARASADDYDDDADGGGADLGVDDKATKEDKGSKDDYDDHSYGRFSRTSFASGSGGEWEGDGAEGDNWDAEGDETEEEEGESVEAILSPELARHLDLIEKQKVELQARTQLQLQTLAEDLRLERVTEATFARDKETVRLEYLAGQSELERLRAGVLAEAEHRKWELGRQELLLTESKYRTRAVQDGLDRRTRALERGGGDALFDVMGLKDGGGDEIYVDEDAEAGANKSAGTRSRLDYSIMQEEHEDEEDYEADEQFVQDAEEPQAEQNSKGVDVAKERPPAEDPHVAFMREELDRLTQRVARKQVERADLLQREQALRTRREYADNMLTPCSHLTNNVLLEAVACTQFYPAHHCAY
jgi:hypothetical protein